MYCPACPEERLLITERSGIEIDYCGKCRGVWLDRGELDKLLERAASVAAPAPVAATTGGAAARPWRDDDDDDDDDDRRREARRYDGRVDPRTGKPKKKKSSFLSEFFEFGD